MWSGGPAGICTRASVTHGALVTDEAAVPPPSPSGAPSEASFSEACFLHGGAESEADRREERS